MRRRPQLEGFRFLGIEVLLLTDRVDEFWIPTTGGYAGKPFRSAAGADTDPAFFGNGMDSAGKEGETVP